MPTSRPMSPVRVVQNALRAALELGFSSHQCPISTNEQRPMISQPSRSWMVFSAMTRFSIAGGEQADEGEVVREADVALHVLHGEDVDEQRDDGHHERAAPPRGRRCGCRCRTRCRPTATTSTTRRPARRRRAASSSARGITAWPTLWMRPRAPSPCPASSTRCIHWRRSRRTGRRRPRRRRWPSSAPLKGRRLPKNRMRKNATAGMTGISQALLRNQPPAVVTSSVTSLLLSEHEAHRLSPSSC